jgi:hypothetical protein
MTKERKPPAQLFSSVRTSVLINLHLLNDRILTKEGIVPVIPGLPEKLIVHNNLESKLISVGIDPRDPFDGRISPVTISRKKHLQ